MTAQIERIKEHLEDGKFHDDVIIKFLVEKIDRLNLAIKHHGKWLHEGKWLSVVQVCNVCESLTGEKITRETMAYRLKTRGNVHDAIYFRHKYSDLDTYVCPDNVMRSHIEIAEYLGLEYQTWMSRLHYHGLKKAFNMGGPQRIHKVKKEDELLDCEIKGPTDLEKELWGDKQDA